MKYDCRVVLLLLALAPLTALPNHGARRSMVASPTRSSRLSSRPTSPPSTSALTTSLFDAKCDAPGDRYRADIRSSPTFRTTEFREE